MEIMQVAYRGDVERMRATVEEHGGNVNHQDCQRRTPLLSAVWNGHSGMVRYLLDAGANINHRDVEGWTALHEGCRENPHRNRHVELASFLLQRGADFTAVTSYGMTALIIAAAHGRESVVRVLLEHGGSNVDAYDNAGQTVMHYACCEGHAGVLRQLLEAGADPALRDEYGRTAVDLAAQRATMSASE